MYPSLIVGTRDILVARLGWPLAMRLATALIGGAYLHGNGDENKNKEQEGSVLSHSDKQLASADENEEPQMTLC